MAVQAAVLALPPAWHALNQSEVFPSIIAFRRSCPQEASISPPRLRRTVAVMPWDSSRLLERRHTAAGLQGAFHHVVEGNEIHMARHPVELPGDQIRLPVVVVDAVDHGVLKGNPPPGLLEIPVAGLKQLLYIIGPVHRHDPGAGLTVRRMERDGQRQLQSQVRQAVNARDHAAGGQGDVPHPDVQSVRVVHQLQKPQHIVQIVHRLADAHQHDIGDGEPRVLLGRRSPDPASLPASSPGPCRRWWRRRRHSPCGIPPERRCRRCCRGDSCIKTDSIQLPSPSSHRYLMVPSCCRHLLAGHLRRLQ